MSKNSGFNFLKTEFVYKSPAPGQHLWQLLNDRHVSVLDIGYDLTSSANKSVVEHNDRQPGATKASHTHFPANANNCYFKINDPSLFERYRTTEPLPPKEDQQYQKIEKRNATKEITDAFMNSFVTQAVASGKSRKLRLPEDVSEINLYPAKGNERFLSQMKNLLWRSGIQVEDTSVKLASNKDTPALTLDLR